MYADRFPEYRDAGFYRPVLGWSVSSPGIGTYLGEVDRASYRNQRSERCIGTALQRLDRDEVVVCAKAGFLTSGAVPCFLQKEDVVGGMHSMSPEFLAGQIERSRANLGVDTIDVFYLHNPETQLGFLTREAFEARIRRAGAATSDGFRKKGALSLGIAVIASGISVALVGMGRCEHVLENPGVARVPPATRDAYPRLYR